MEAIGGADLSTLRNETREVLPYVSDPAPATKTIEHILSPGVFTVGVRRPMQPGTRGVALTVTTNHFAINLRDNLIFQYDVIIERVDLEPTSVWMPTKWNQELLQILQEKVAPTLFTPRAVYDGRKNLFASHCLPLRGCNGNSQAFDVTRTPPYERPPPQVYKVTLRLVKKISTIMLKQYCNGQSSVDNEIHASFTPLNIVLRMKSMLSRTNAFTLRRLLTDQEMRPLGAGVELWRGYFQSIRPGVRSLLVKLDISAGAMYMPGPMIEICHQILGSQEPLSLVPGEGLTDQDRLRMQRFFSSVRFVTIHPTAQARRGRNPKTLRQITAQGANDIRFIDREGREITVAEHFLSLGITLRHPRCICLQTSNGAVYPMELCFITPGQCIRQKPSSMQLDDAALFMRKTPQGRLDSIVAGHGFLNYHASEYMQSFEMTVDPLPEKCSARILKAPLLDYGSNLTRRPENGEWNLKDRKVYKSATISGWAMIVYDSRNWNLERARIVVCCLTSQAAQMGMHMDKNPPILFPPAQHLDVAQHLMSAGREVVQKYRIPAPTLLVVVLPENSADLYKAVKHFGNVTTGVATQCLKASRTRSSSAQYWSNVCLKINAKLGGVNAKLSSSSSPARILRSESPSMIMAGRIMHPPPGASGSPSFAGMVGSLDADMVRYSAVNSVLGSRLPMISNLENMAYELISRYSWWKTNRESQTKPFPERIVYYRGGISDSDFSALLDIELPVIKAACKRHKIQPKITVISVGKRHHVRFFPTHGMADRTGNCPAGTVVDDVVGNPQEFDFYLQSHSSSAGTSRPCHYSVLFDENNFSQDDVQELTYALCHIGARTTRSLSAPAPLRYAEMVTAGSKNHYKPSFDPYGNAEGDELQERENRVQLYHENFESIHTSMRYKMYFQ